MALFYMAASLVQDGVESVSSWVLMAGKGGARADEDELRRVSLALGAGTVVGGLAMQMAFPQRPNEPMRFAAARGAGEWLSIGSFAGLAASLGQESLAAIDRRSESDRGLRNLPAGILAGAAFAAVRHVQFRQRQALDADNADLEELSISGPEVARDGCGDLGGADRSLAGQPGLHESPRPCARQVPARRRALLAPVHAPGLDGDPRRRTARGASTG